MGSPQIIGRYALYRKIASGGMATIHLGRLLGPVGFSRTVAIKRMHPHFTEDPEFVSMFLDEARLAARIRHPNVVPTLDVVATAGELFLVLEYIHGQTLARLAKLVTAREERIPVPIAAAIASGVLHGLHAAHEAKNERGEPLGIVHRDVSPQNIMVGVDGIPRVLDFGVAKAMGRLQTTRNGILKGKLSYISPEQIRGSLATRRSDVYSASVVLWEVLTGRRLFDDTNDGAVMNKILEAKLEPPSKHASEVPAALDEIVLRGLDRDPDKRFATAREMANAINQVVASAISPVLGEWVEHTAAEPIARQAAWVAEIESGSGLIDSAAASAPDSDEASPSSIPQAHADVTDLATMHATLVSQPSTISVATPAASSHFPEKRRTLMIAGAVLAFALTWLVGFVMLGTSPTPVTRTAATFPKLSIDNWPPLESASAAAPAEPPIVDLDEAKPGDEPRGSDTSRPKQQTNGSSQSPKPASKKQPARGYNPLDHL